MGNELQVLAAALAPLIEQEKARKYGIGLKHDSAGNPITVGFNHGPGGLLTYPGVDPIVFSAMVGNVGLISQLPTMPSVYTDPTYFTITGIQDDIGNEKEDVCDDAPTAGLMKGCMLRSVFGRYERATPELEVNRLGQRIDRADPLDLQLVNSPIGNSGIWSGPSGTATPADVLTNEVSRKFLEMNTSLHRLFSRQIWTGTPANNAGGGGYKEMTGLSTLINTGHVDAETGVACPSLDSLVTNFNYGSVSSSGADAVNHVTAVYHNLVRRAETMNMTSVRWIIVMRTQMFYELTAVWPCSYLSFRCSPSNGATEFIDAQDAVRFRDEMRSGRYLLIDGVRVDVVLDDGIPELDGNSSGGNFPAGCFSSDIYIIPMSVLGRAVTFMEYFDYSNPSLQSAIQNLGIYRVEGAFITTARQKNWCIVWQTKVEPRLVVRTPWLAGRIQHVVYCPAIHEREAFPDDPYLTDGGKTYRNNGQGPSLYSLWQV